MTTSATGIPDVQPVAVYTADPVLIERLKAERSCPSASSCSRAERTRPDLTFQAYNRADRNRIHPDHGRHAAGRCRNTDIGRRTTFKDELMREIATLSFVLLLMAAAAEAQQERAESPFAEALETDRDSFTPSTTTVGACRTVVEAAYSFIDNRDVKETHSYPEMLVRIGVDEDIELRLGWNYEVGGAGSDVSGAGGHEFEAGALERQSTLSYGFKGRLVSRRGWLPENSVILGGRTPTSGESNDTHVVATYVFGWELPARSKLDAAIRYATASEDEDFFNIWAPSVVYKWPLGERLEPHVEYFALFSDGKEDEFAKHYVSPGAHYLITSDLEVGVRLGWGLNDDASKFFTNAGLGWRF
jgi:hypothetical protein